MATQKKQHFVSQLLLRNFSSGGNRNLIHLYNREIDKTVENAPIKGQAQESYFYGNDLAFEKYLQVTEERVAPIIKRIIEDNDLPIYPSEDYSYLLHFMMLYASRTKANVENMEERINSTFKEMAKHDSRFRE